MKLWLLALLVTSRVAAAEPERRIELMPTVGIAATGPRAEWSLGGDALDGKAVSPQLGISIAWKHDPFSLPRLSELNWRWILGTFRWDPEVTLQGDAHSAIEVPTETTLDMTR